MRTRTWLTGLIALSISLTACGDGGDGDGEQQASSTDDTLTIALADVPREQFDPSLGTATAKVYQSLMYDWLIGARPDGEFDMSTGVAEAWEYSPDGATFTVTVREGIEFWNGMPLTADDVVFSLERIIDPAATSSGSATLRGVIESITKTDERTVTVQLQRPFLFLPEFLSRLGVTDGAVVSKAYFDEVGADEFASSPMGSGRYELVSSGAGTEFTFERNENYWLGVEGRFSEVVLQHVPEEQTRLALLQRGEADIVGVSAQAAADLSGDGIQVAEQPGKANLSLNYHEQWIPENPMSNAQFREALNLSINRDEIVEQIFFGRGESYGVPQLGPSNIGFDADVFRPYEYDPERAAQLIEQSGYAADPVPIDVYQFTWPGVPEMPQVMEAVAGYFQEIGVEVNLVRSDYNTLRELWGQFAVGPGVHGNGADNRPAYPVELIWSIEGSLSNTHDPELNALVEAWTFAASEGEAVSAIQAIGTYVRDEDIGTSIVTVSTLYGLGPEVEPWDGLESVFPFEMSLDGLLTSS